MGLSPPLWVEARWKSDCTRLGRVAMRFPDAVLRVMLVAGGLAACRQPAAARRRPLSLDVRPSPRIEARIRAEVEKARRILEDPTPDNLFDSPYLVSAIYYHDGFLAGFPVDRPSADPERRIVGQIYAMLTPERKARYVGLLHELWEEHEPPGPERLLDPLAYGLGNGGGRSHRDAVDLFAPEGTPVHSASRGIVVLADRGWSAGDVFSTSSRKGGNAVIVFDPDHNRFYRYCHLSAVLVSAGDLVEAGHVVGRVGHSGLNASRPGHGHHLHFEVNQYADGYVRAWDRERLRSTLAAWGRAPITIAASAEPAAIPTPIPDPPSDLAPILEPFPTPPPDEPDEPAR